MVPTTEMPARGRSPARASDVSDGDDSTVYSDTESIFRRSTTSFDTGSFSRFSYRDRQDATPAFRFGREENHTLVYEAWNIHYFPGKRITTNGVKVLGVNVQKYRHVGSRYDIRPRPSTESDMIEMHFRAIGDFKAKQKRSLAAICGKGKTYEQDLEERCREVPEGVQSAITQLLLDRGKATSTRYRTRTWTVVAMEEQLRHRFAKPNFTKVKHHKLRFWKNHNHEEPLLYTLVIRGAQTSVCTDEEGIRNFAPFSNPWTLADGAEARRKLLQRIQQRQARFRKERGLSSSRQADRERSVSPPSYRRRPSLYRSYTPSTRSRNRFSRDESPPPYRRRQAHSSILSRSPSVRIRVMPRFDDELDDMPAPTPPESYTPPPGVSAYNRHPIPPPPFPTTYPRPFHPPPAMPPLPPLTTTGIPPPPFQYPVSPASGSPFGPRPFGAPEGPSTPPPCIGCRSSTPCAHYPGQLRHLPCARPLRWWGNVAYHPPCTICFRTSPPPPPPFGPHPLPFDHFSAPAYFSPSPPPPPETPPPPPFSSLTTPSISTAASANFPPMPPPPPFSPVSTPPLSRSPSLSGHTLSGPHTPTLSQSPAPEVREDNGPGSPRNA